MRKGSAKTRSVLSVGSGSFLAVVEWKNASTKELIFWKRQLLKNGAIELIHFGMEQLHGGG